MPAERFAPVPRTDIATAGSGRRGRISELTPEQRRERSLAAQGAWRKANRDKVAAYRKAWQAANPGKVREANRRAYAKRTGKAYDPERTPGRRVQPKPNRPRAKSPQERKARIREVTSAWRERRREHIREQARINRNKPAARAAAKAYRERTKAIQRERHRRWRDSQPDYKAKKRAYMIDYHAKKRDDPADRERRIRNGRNSYARMMQSPERHARKLDWARARYARLRADPQRYAAFMATQREQTKRRNEQKRLRTKPAYMRSMMENIMRLIPRSLHPELREDLRNDFVRDILAGEITVQQVPRVMRRYAAEARKMMSNRFKFVSLDDTIPGTDGLAIVDTIAADRLHF